MRWGGWWRVEELKSIRDQVRGDNGTKPEKGKIKIIRESTVKSLLRKFKRI